MFTHFYKESIRKTVIGFGSLFNNILISRKNSDGTEKEQIRVPLSYGAKEKFIRRIMETSSISDDNKVVDLPRMSFEITNYIYDSSRKRNSLTRRMVPSSDPTKSEFVYAEVPYDISFIVQSYVRNMDDALQITEQILPYFTPDFTMTINFNDINKKVDIPITLNDVTLSEEYEGNFDTRRLITTQYTFTAKTYIFGPTKEQKTVRSADVVFFDFNEEDNWNVPRGTGGTGPGGAANRFVYGVSGDINREDFNYTDDINTNKFIGGSTGSGGMDIYGNTYA